jgi:transposase InsO family protein
MPWKETYVMDQKKEFVLEAMDPHCNFTQLCSKFGITPKTGYKWKSRFIQEGFAGLADQSRRPDNSPTQIPEDVMLEIIRLKLKKKYWGSKKIRQVFKQNNSNKKTPCLTSVERILRKAGLVKKRKRNRTGKGIRLETRTIAQNPNDVWTVDFKGWWYTPDKEKVNPLTVRDDFSKYILCIKALYKGDIPSVKYEFEQLFKRFGLPKVIRSDNGPPFASKMSLLGLTKLSVWWMALGIQLDRIEPGKPHQNGSHERMHLDMKNELESRIEGDIEIHQKEFDKWRKEYNNERPHESLNLKTPQMVYIKSNVKYDGVIEDLEYPGNFRNRLVNNRGYISIKKRMFFIGNPFMGYYVGIRPEKNGDQKVWFGDYLLGTLDLDTGLLNPEKNVLYKKGTMKKLLPMS